MHRHSLPLAAIAVLLVLAGCVTTEEYDQVVKESENYKAQAELDAMKNEGLTKDKAQLTKQVQELTSAKSETEKQNGSLGLKVKDLAEQLSLASSALEKAKTDLAAAQDESKVNFDKAKVAEDELAKLNAQLKVSQETGDKTQAELQATIEKLQVELKDANAQIDKLVEEAAKEENSTEANAVEKAEPKVKDVKVDKVDKPKP